MYVHFVFICDKEEDKKSNRIQILMNDVHLSSIALLVRKRTEYYCFKFLYSKTNTLCTIKIKNNNSKVMSQNLQ